mgnify:CR=1 FL=1
MAERGGFTLIEMLVALAVFSLAAMALLNLSGESTRSAQRVEVRTLGGMVAENVAVEAAVSPALGEGEGSGHSDLGGRRWAGGRAVTAAADPGLLRIDVHVRDEEGQAADRTLFRRRAP